MESLKILQDLSDIRNSSERCTVLYKDDHLVAVDKPAGLLVHRSKIAHDAKEFAVQQVRDLIGQPVFLTHRLDRPTSGVLLFGLNSKIAKSVCQQFEKRLVEKNYHAIVRGIPQKQGTWNEPLHEKFDRITDSKANPQKPKQNAETQFESLETWEIPYCAGKYPTSIYSLIRIKPLTGRRHQIRRHFNHMGNPVIGDTTHGDRRHNRLYREQLGIDRLLLVASSLEFTHPITGETILVTAKLGKQFEYAICQLRKLNIR